MGRSTALAAAVLAAALICACSAPPPASDSLAPATEAVPAEDPAPTQPTGSSSAASAEATLPLAAASAEATLASAPASAESTLPTTASQPASPAAEPFSLTCQAFADGEQIPDAQTYSLPGQCAGPNISPPLSWAGAPGNTQSLAITMVDPDGGGWVHWVQFNIPANATSLPAAANGPAIGIKGVNDFGENGYGGPCPPSGTHRYVLTLYALDTTLSLAEGASKAQVDAAMAGHVLAQAQLTGLRSR
ncbi:MAG: YbhB/YbcL family Raf kinase inhibitor-like protein [Anaerolineae bacterium]